MAAWLENHPTITHLSRDHAVSYIDAAWRGAPQAQQVADRWHLLKNISDELIAVCDGHQRAIDAAVSGPPLESRPADLPPGREPDPHASPYQSPPPAAPTPRDLRHTTIHRLHTLGWTQRAIAAAVGLHPKTVSHQLRAPLGAVPQRLRRRTCLDPYLPYLFQRWEADCTNAHQLFVEIQAQGFPASHSTVREWAGHRRKEQGLPSILPAQIRAEAPTRTTILHRRTLVAWVMRRPDTATPRQETQIAQIMDAIPALKTAITLAQAFAVMVRQRDVPAFTGWLAQMQASGLQPFRRLATSFQQDALAIRAALTRPWSNGPVEGTINRLKLLKRQMYGRAKLDLLRHRLLAP